MAFSFFFAAVSICEDDRETPYMYRMCVHASSYERISKWICVHVEENGMSSRVKTNYDHRERELMRARTHSHSHRNAYVWYAVDNAFSLLRDLYELCGSVSLCVCLLTGTLNYRPCAETYGL